MDITLGLDFGTHQSKLCISYNLNNEYVYEFIEFTLADGTKSVLFPSLIQINKDDTIRVGSIDYETCAMRSIAPPHKPIFPLRPEIALPKEPDMTLPPEPKREFSNPQIEYGEDWKTALKAIKNSMEAPPKNQASFNREHRDWERKCQEIKQRHKRWEIECQRINDQLIQWQKKVDAINSEYEEKREFWQNHNTEPRVMRYFKQAAFTDTMPWNHNEISADSLSVWYLTYLLLVVKRYVKERFNEEYEKSVAVQMGVPSGLHDGESRMIRYHGKTLLVAARQLMDWFDSPEELCSMSYEDLIDMIKYSKNVEEDALNYGFVVIPEAFAGLRSLTYNKRLTQGKMHLFVDIGGGTTDIAFFTIDEGRMPSIHTVRSFHKGLNYVLELFIKEHPSYSMGEVQDLLRANPSRFNDQIVNYTVELKKELNGIIQHVINEFNVAVAGTGLKTSQLVDAMIERPIVYCGGGSLYSNMQVCHQYFSDKRQINKDTLGIPNLINRGLPLIYYTILATAYGLSIPSIDDIKTIDVIDLWNSLAEGVKIEKPNLDKPDYGLSDD